MTFLCYKLCDLPADSAAQALLDASELAAYAQRGDTFLKTRSTLKRELARRLDTPASELHLSMTEHGKPILPGSPLHFNLSHSAEHLCIAFHSSPVGVDIQLSRPKAATERLAARIMCPQQLQAWRARGATAAEFFDCWCTAEALVKQAAATIWQAQQFPFLWYPGRIQPLFAGAPHVRLFTPADGYHGAVAYHPSPSEQA